MGVQCDSRSTIQTSRKPKIQLEAKYCTIFSEFGVHVELVRLIKMHLHETYSKVLTGKHHVR
jgi:hypothetical protein